MNPLEEKAFMKICCVETVKLPSAWIKGTNALPVDFFEQVRDSDMRWIERSEAETDPAYKQIIPYIVMQDSAARILCYPRHGSEERLHGLFSCGIGGHIDEGDHKGGFAETVKAGMFRELSEEIHNFNPELVDLVYKGLINELDTPVGAVHLGLVYLAVTRTGYRPEASGETAGMTWKTIKELKSLNMEHWSWLALKLI
jgi:predicted NUDIX family phosphoesterase